MLPPDRQGDDRLSTSAPRSARQVEGGCGRRIKGLQDQQVAAGEGGGLPGEEYHEEEGQVVFCDTPREEEYVGKAEPVAGIGWSGAV